MTASDRYATPTAFRRALTDRLKSLSGTSHWTMPQLQRHAADDRLNEALNLVKLFIDPLLDQSAAGHWDPGSRQWVEA